MCQVALESLHFHLHLQSKTGTLVPPLVSTYSYSSKNLNPIDPPWDYFFAFRNIFFILKKPLLFIF